MLQTAKSTFLKQLRLSRKGRDFLSSREKGLVWQTQCIKGPFAANFEDKISEYSSRLKNYMISNI